MLKIRRPLGRLIFNMGIAIPGKTVFLIETTPWWWIMNMACFNLRYNSVVLKCGSFSKQTSHSSRCRKGLWCFCKFKLVHQSILTMDVLHEILYKIGPYHSKIITSLGCCVENRLLFSHYRNSHYDDKTVMWSSYEVILTKEKSQIPMRCQLSSPGK